MSVTSIQSSNLYNFIKCQDGPPSPSCCRRIGKISSGIFAAGLALCARIPAIPISRKAGGEFAPFGWTLAMVNIISYGSLISWSFLKVIEEKTRAKTEEEKELKSTFSPQIQVAILATSVFLGVFSQIPFGYMAYEYNNSSWLMAGTILLGDSPFPIYSLTLSFEKTIRKKSLLKIKKTDPKFLENRSNLLKTTKYFKKSLPERFLQKIGSDRALLVLNQGMKRKRPIWQKGARGFTKGVGVIATFGRLLMFSALAYEGASLISGGTKQNPNGVGGEVFACSIALLVALSNVYLLKTVILKSSVKNVQLGIDLLTKNYQPTLGDAMRTKLYRALQISSLILVALSFSTPYQVSKDTFEHSVFHNKKIAGLEPFVVATSTYSVLSMVSYSLRYFIDEAINKYVKLRGTEIEQEYSLFQEKISKIEKLIEGSTYEEVQSFLRNLLDHSQQNLNDSLESQLLRELIKEVNVE